MKRYRLFVAVFGLMYSLAILTSFHYDLWLGLMSLIVCICFFIYVFKEEEIDKEEKKCKK